jgi:arylsulfatase
VVSWPGHTAQPGVVRTQFAHVNDIAPTIYQAAGIKFPDTVNGTRQIPLEGKSLVPTFTDPAAKTGHNEQYFEIFGNRAIYKDGWVAGARRYAPWELFSNPAKIFAGDISKDKWELYHVDTDFSEAHDLAAREPQKLAQMKAEFDKEAKRNGLYPLVPVPLLGAPSPLTGRKHFSYAAGVERIPLAVTPDLTAQHWKLTAELDAPPSGADGVLVAEGGRYGGFSLFVKGGKLIYENNTFGETHQQITSDAPLAAGHNKVEVEFTPDLDIGSMVAAVFRKKAGPGNAVLTLNGKTVGQAHFNLFGGFTSSINETFDIGRDTGSPVSADYAAPDPYAGHVARVTVDLL